MEILHKFATTTEEADVGFADMLGIDWKIFIFQIIAFLFTVWLLGKFVYPWLLKSVDDRQKKIDSGSKAATEAQKLAENTEKRIAKLLNEARIEANDVIATAKAESVAIITATEDKSKKLADEITTAARKQIDADILIAKKAIRSEMVELVALATEKVVGKVVIDDVDNTIIADSLRDVK